MPDASCISIGSQGTFQKTGNVGTTPDDVKAIIDHVRQNKVDRIGIFVHGGLVDEAAGRESAKRFSEVFAGADAYGISLIWKTGWWETIEKNLSTLFSSELFRRIVEKVVKMVVGHLTALGAKGPGDATVEAATVLRDGSVDHMFAEQARAKVAQLSAADLDKWRKEMVAELEEDVEDDKPFQAVYLDPEQRSSCFDDPRQAAQADPKAPQQKAVPGWFSVAAKISLVAWRVGTRFWNGRDHGFHATAVEEVFREFYLADLFKTLEWDNMKLAARQMWLPNDGLDGTAQHAGTYLVEQLIILKQERPGLTIDFVAHSAGAIVVCEMFALIHQRYAGRLPVRNVVFLAPACTSPLFYTNMLVGEPLFSDLYLFAMPDELERSDAVLRPVSSVLGVVYPSSLLYVVSGILEEEADSPLLGMVRFDTGEPPFDSQKLEKIHAYLAEAGKQRLTLSSAGAPPLGLASGATSHGAFSSDEATLRSIQTIIKRSNAATRASAQHQTTPSP
jgi:hypothetical protein